MKKVRKAVIPVAGMGTRFLPVTKAVPKEMLPIIDKPTLQYIIEEAVESGIEEILLITNQYKKCIEDHFDKSYELEQRLEKSGKLEALEMVKDISSMVKIYYVRQGEPLGSAHAINLARTFVGDEPFALMFGDDLMSYVGCEPVLKQLINIYEQNDCNVIGVQEVDPKLVYKYGIISFENEDIGKIKSIVEKPKVGEAPSNTAVYGRYIIKSEIFDILDNLGTGVGGEYQITDGLRKLMDIQPFYACKFKGKYYDIGNQMGYLKANIDFALDREDLKEQVKAFIETKKVKAEANYIRAQ